MKAIDKMVRFLEIFDQDVICAGGNSRGGFAEIRAEARRLAAEEKAGDEGLRQYLKREIHLLKTQSMDGPFQDGMKYAYENILSRHPVPEQKAPVGLVEELAGLEHEQWIAWSQQIARTEAISQERLDRWKKCWVPYSKLTEEMKEHDRIWARRIPEIISRYRPCADRTEELVDKIRKTKCAVCCKKSCSGCWIHEVLRDFEKGAK